jgi:predicted transcriptional regulator
MANATSLKLPPELRARVLAAAEAAGTSPHAFMVEAIVRETTRAEQYDAFLDDARTAEAEVDRTGVHYAAEDVIRYMTSRAMGKRARRPKPKSWRK